MRRALTDSCALAAEMGGAPLARQPWAGQMAAALGSLSVPLDVQPVSLTCSRPLTMHFTTSSPLRGVPASDSSWRRSVPTATTFPATCVLCHSGRVAARWRSCAPALTGWLRRPAGGSGWRAASACARTVRQQTRATLRTRGMLFSTAPALHSVPALHSSL